MFLSKAAARIDDEGWSARLKWRLAPGNEIALIYSKNWERRWDPQACCYPSEERGVFKISLSVRP